MLFWMVLLVSGHRGRRREGLIAHQNPWKEQQCASHVEAVYFKTASCSSITLSYTAPERARLDTPKQSGRSYSKLQTKHPLLYILSPWAKKNPHSLILPSTLTLLHSVFCSGMSSLQPLSIKYSAVFPMHGFTHLAVLQLLMLLWIPSF